MLSKPISAQQFWGIYFRNDFLTLERHTNKYLGRIFDKKSTTSSGKGLLDDYAEVFVDISIDALRAYDYLSDGRFVLIAQRPTDLGLAVEAVIKQSYPYRDPAPFGKRRMAELFAYMNLSKAVPTITALEKMVLNVVEKYNQAQAQSLAALAWLLGELRQRSSAEALLNIVHNAPFNPSSRHNLPFTVVDTALSALWKVNDKSSLVNFLGLLRDINDAGWRKIAPLFERLLSTKELLSLERCGDDYYRSGFWEGYLASRRGFTDLDWDRFDADSLFWELRYLAALRLSLSETVVLNQLAKDEVWMVATAANQRLTSHIAG